MKRTIVSIYLLATYCILLMSQNFNTVGSNNYLKVGDSIHYDFVTPTISQSSSVSEHTWDFSNSKYLGTEKEVFFVGKDYNHIKMIDKDAILDFSQDKDRLLLKSLQTPLLNFDFGNSFDLPYKSHGKGKINHAKQ